MAAPTYSTDLTTINVVDTAGGTTNWSALGGGSAGLASETDYYIQGDGCLSKQGFTASTKGMIYSAGATTIASGDALFIWMRQSNRNLLDTTANGGGQVVIGSGTGAYDHFYVDGSDAEGSDLLSWVCYAVDPTQTPSTTTGSPSGTSYFGALWKTLGSGSLKGAPNAVDAFRHGRELRAVDGDGTSGYATFTGMATHDSDTTRRYGILTEATGTLLFHGALVLGQSGTSVDFRDSNVSISVLEDAFIPSTFNEIQIIHASSNVEWNTVQIAHLGSPATSPTTLTLDVGTFTGDSCRFDGCGTTTFNSNGSGSCTNTTWVDSGQIVLNEADISGSNILTSTVAADEGAIYDNRTTTTDTSITELDNCTISKGTNAHHAIRFGANVDDNITLTGIEFTGFNGTDSVNDSTIRFDDTTGSINLTLVNCTADGAAASDSNIGIDSAGITVTIITGAVDVTVTTVDDAGAAVGSANAFLKAANGTGPFPYQESVTISRATTTATVTHTAHGMATNDKVLIEGITDKEEDNAVHQITVTGANTYTYTTTDSGSTSYSGTITSTFVALEGLTNATTGILTVSRVYSSNQPVTGWTRKSTSSPYFKQAGINATISSSTGLDQTAVMVSDE